MKSALVYSIQPDDIDKKIRRGVVADRQHEHTKIAKGDFCPIDEVGEAATARRMVTWLDNHGPGWIQHTGFRLGEELQGDQYLEDRSEDNWDVRIYADRLVGL